METFFKRLTGTLLLLTMFVGHFSATAQDATEGVPLVREGVKWIYNYNDYSLEYTACTWTFCTVEFHGTTEIDGKTYANCYYYIGDEPDYSDEALMGWARQEGSKVFARYNEGCTFVEHRYHDLLNFSILPFDEEVTLYDFDNFADGESNSYMQSRYSVPDDTYTLSTIEVNGHTRRVWTATWGYDDVVLGMDFVEGVGPDDFYNTRSSRSLLLPYLLGSESNLRMNHIAGLSHVVGEDGEIEYEGHNYLYYKTKQDEWEDTHGPADYIYVPLVRQGVKWIYNCNHPNGENGFYTMTFKGTTTINGVEYANLYWYEGYTPEPDAVPFAWMREVDKRVYIIYNDAFDRDEELVRTEPWVQIPGEYPGEWALYDFNNMGALWAQGTLRGSSYNGLKNWRTSLTRLGRNSTNNMHYRNTHINSTMGIQLLEGVGPNGTMYSKYGTNIAYPYTIIRDTYVHNTARLSHVIDGNDEIEYKTQDFNPDFTGIDGVKESGPTPQLRTGFGGIDIDGDYRGPVDVIDLSGRVVARQTIDGTAHIAVEPGIYVVRLAGHSHKIVVR